MKTYNILIDNNIPLLPNALSNCANIQIFHGRELTNAQVLDFNCDILFVRSITKVNEELLKNSKVELVGTATSGSDHFDKDYLSSKHIKYVDSIGSNANSVAEYVVYSMLKWAKIEKTTLKSKSIGIIGYGHVGKTVAKYADLLGMKIYVNDPPLKDDNYIFPDNVTYLELDKLCATCDVITVHTPLMKNGKYPTIHLINKNNIALFKNYCLFINAARGGVADEIALIDAHKTKNVYIAIDVWENEPRINPLLPENTILSTYHIAGLAYEGKVWGVLMLANHFKDFTGIEPDYTEINDCLSKYHPLDKKYYSDENYILNILGEYRKFEQDFIETNGILSLPDIERGKSYDKLRNGYPIRHEIL